VTCKHCGTEIAANALICYRCGQATAELPAASSLASRTGRRGGWVSVLAAIILVVAALYMGRSTYVGVPREVPWLLGGLAAIVLAWLLWKRGRR